MWQHLRNFCVWLQLGFLIALWIWGPRWMRQATGLPVGQDRLMAAAATGNSDEVQAAIADGADVNARDLRGDSPLIYAAAFGNATAAGALLKAGAEVNRPGARGSTALISAAGAGQIELVAMLLEAGANPFALDDQGQSARTIADLWGQPKVVRLLDAYERERGNRLKVRSGCDSARKCHSAWQRSA